MADSVGVLLASLKAAVDIVNGLRAIDKGYGESELKMKIISLVDTLADAKLAGLKMKEELADKEQKIAQLEEFILRRGCMVRYLEAYYEDKGDGEGKGQPFCSVCCEVSKKFVHLIRDSTDRNKTTCPSCGTVYASSRCPSLR